MIQRLYKLPVVLLLAFCMCACAHTQMSDRSDVKNESVLNSGSINRVLIVYQSKYGSTKQYAQWIQREIPSELADADTADKREFAKYDMIMFGSSIRMGRIVIAPLIIESWDAVKGKKVVLFTTSGTPPDHPNIRKIYERNLPEGLRKEIKYFPLHGRMLINDLSFIDKFLVAIGQIMEKDESIAKRMREDYDEMKQENLLPLLEYVKAQLARSSGQRD
ncbi:MAG: flavodoxin domain-containing protein [Syntrophaceae bacterium]